MPPKQRLRWPRRRWYAPADACGVGQQGAMAIRCCGLTRKGARCSITSTSRLADEQGRLVAEPLQRGGAYCRFHARPFVTHSVGYFDGPAVLFYLDRKVDGPSYHWATCRKEGCDGCCADSDSLGVALRVQLRSRYWGPFKNLLTEL